MCSLTPTNKYARGNDGNNMGLESGIMVPFLEILH